MGGFVLYNGDVAVRPLRQHELEPYLRRGDIDVTMEEIQDKSKGDALAKAFVLFQTGWFILQLIARGIERLPITELELLTLAFSMINFVTYGIWWNKPLNVECPIPVCKEKSSLRKRDLSVTDFPPHGQPPTSQDLGLDGRENEGPIIRPRTTNEIEAKGGELSVSNSQNLPSNREKDDKTAEDTAISDLSTRDDRYATFALIGVGTIFGAVHCIAWSFHFPTHVEKIIWRVCSVLVTVVPSIILLFNPVDNLFFPEAWVDRMIAYSIDDILLSAVAILYVLARLILLIEAFVTLRSLPPDAYTTVHWTTFIPHI